MIKFLYPLSLWERVAAISMIAAGSADA